MTSVDQRPNLCVADVGLEKVAHFADTVGFFGLLVEQEFLEFVVDQFPLILELRNEAEGFFHQFSHRDTAIDACGAAQLLQAEKLARLVE